MKNSYYTADGRFISSNNKTVEPFLGFFGLQKTKDCDTRVLSVENEMNTKMLAELNKMSVAHKKEIFNKNKECTTTINDMVNQVAEQLGEEIKKKDEEIKKKDEEIKKKDEEIKKKDEEIKKKDLTTTSKIVSSTIKQSGIVREGCCGGNGGTPYELVCPEGSYVNEFYGNARNDYVVSSIGIKCTDGKDYGKKGGNDGSSYSIKSDNGFNRIDVKSGIYVDNIKFFNSNQEIKSIGGIGGQGPHNLNCGTDGKIMGVQLRAGNIIDNVKIICGKEQ